MLNVFTFLTIAFSALLPVINPLGSALVFLGLVGPVHPSEYKRLARKIAVTTILLLTIVEVAGSFILRFFGISLPVVQLAGGCVLAAMGWNLLNQKDDGVASAGKSGPARDSPSRDADVFYPLTFPVTAGPGCIVIALTLSAHAAHGGWENNLFAHVGILGGILLNGALVYACYAYAPNIARWTSPQTLGGLMRIIAFLLLCIGVQIAWNGVTSLIHPT